MDGKDITVMEYEISLIEGIEFESIEPLAVSLSSTEDTSFRLTAKEQGVLPPKPDIVLLRIRLSEFFHTKLLHDYNRLEVECDIKRDTFHRFLKFRNGKNITYVQLAKFSVGARLSVDEARELFVLMGQPLNERNRYDYILLCELNHGSSIAEYDDDLHQYGYPSIFSKAD